MAHSAAAELLPIPNLHLEPLHNYHFDALILVAPTFKLEELTAIPSEKIRNNIVEAKKYDNQVGVSVTMLNNLEVPGSRLILAPTGSLTSDTADVRTVGDAARKGMARAKSAGSKKPLVALLAIEAKGEYEHATEVALLSMYAEIYVALQAREYNAALETVVAIGFVARAGEQAAHIQKVVYALESGRRLARDVGGADCERMAPLRCAEYIQAALKSHATLHCTLKADPEILLRDYPLLHAVARSSLHVPRHLPCVLRIEYSPEHVQGGAGGDPHHTLLFAGKGVTYDTGGADLKTGGHMAGMSKDKCGAANVAGFLKAVAMLAPRNVRVIAELGFVRNSIGSNAYVADEIIRSHAGVRVLIGNTDAEGRMVLADLLSHLREEAVTRGTPRPEFFSVATLTGHAPRAVGSYPIVIDNAVAHSKHSASHLSAAGERFGDPFEISRQRREDFRIVAAKNASCDVYQCPSEPSVNSARGHQFPAAFLQIASGLNKHGRDAALPLPYSHLDIAGGALDVEGGGGYAHGNPSGSPIVALAARYVLEHLSDH